MRIATRSRIGKWTGTLAALGLVMVVTVGCPEAGDPTDRDSSAVQAAQAETERAAALEAEALERRVAEAAAAEAAALEAAEQAMAEREEVLRLREEQLRREEELRRQQVRLAERRAAAEARERQLAAKERELENFETNLEFQENELEDREIELEETLEALALDEEADPLGEASQAEGVIPEVDEELEAGPFVGTDASDSRDLPSRTGSVTASLEPGRLLEIEFEETVSSATHRRGDEFKGRLVQDLTAEDGTLIVAGGAEVIGRVIEATPLKRVGGRSSLEVEFTHLVISPEESVAISASFVEVGADKRKDKKKIAGAAIVGAILGKVLGGDGAEGVLAGAAAGAAAGTVAVTRAEGKEAEIKSGQVVALQLDEVVTVEVRMTGPAER